MQRSIRRAFGAQGSRSESRAARRTVEPTLLGRGSPCRHIGPLEAQPTRRSYAGARENVEPLGIASLFKLAKSIWARSAVNGAPAARAVINRRSERRLATRVTAAPWLGSVLRARTHECVARCGVGSSHSASRRSELLRRYFVRSDPVAACGCQQPAERRKSDGNRQRSGPSSRIPEVPAIFCGAPNLEAALLPISGNRAARLGHRTGARGVRLTALGPWIGPR